MIVALAAVALLLAVAEPAWAWGPGTHVYLGLGLLDALHLVPAAVRDVVALYPFDFLYGSVAADISMAKKYVPEGRHCHFWHVGEEVYERATSDRLRAMALGYLSHLAADVVAHNLFVPRQMVLAARRALGHTYWETRLDLALGPTYAALTRYVVTEMDHSEADALLDRVLSATVFSFRTNRRIFRGLIRAQDSDRWHTMFGSLARSPRWGLPPALRHQYLALAFDAIVDYLRHRQASTTAREDPTGERALATAKQLRRLLAREGAHRRPRLVRELADSFFPVPSRTEGAWEKRRIGPSRHLLAAVGGATLRWG